MAGVRGFKGSWKRITKNCTNWAFYVTVIWLVGAVFYVGFNWCKFLRMEPNALGDFLAGTFSPLALFWLVAGYMQQGKALRLNTHEIKLQRRALLLQHKELAEQVKATLQVAIHTEKQAEASVAMAEVGEKERRTREVAQILSVQPIFDIVATNTFYDDDVEYIIKNVGRPARNVSISSESYESCTANIPFKFDTGGTFLFSLHTLKPGCDKRNFKLNIEYTDIQSYVKGQSFVVIEFNVYPKDFYHVSRIGE